MAPSGIVKNCLRDRPLMILTPGLCPWRVLRALITTRDARCEKPDHEGSLVEFLVDAASSYATSRLVSTTKGYTGSTRRRESGEINPEPVGVSAGKSGAGERNRT